jgi:hypothetical protein
MMKGAVALFVFLACCSTVSGTLYALVSVFQGLSQISVYTVAVDTTTGNWSDPLLQNLVYLDFSLTFDGISAFDTTNSIYYYATDWPAPLVYAADLTSGCLKAPISVGADSIANLIYDTTGQQLLVTGFFGNDTLIVNFSYDYNLRSDVVFNITEHGIFAYCHTLDSVNGIYYIIYGDTDGGAYLGYFPLSNPSNFSSTPLNCDGVSPEYMYYDAKLGKFVGIAYNDGQYYYFEMVNGKCWTHAFLLIEPGFMDYTYDPSETSLYFSYFCAEGEFLGVYNAVTHKFVTTVMPVVIDLEASLSM